MTEPPQVQDLLPFIDSHSVEVEAGADACWRAVASRFEILGTRPAWVTLAAALGCSERHTTGAPGSLGSTIPGFRVVRSAPPVAVCLAGAHRFARYSLGFRIEPLEKGGSRVEAESRAVFPGMFGRAYKMAVIGTGGHRLAVTGLLRALKRSAERPVA